MVGDDGIEPPHRASKAPALPLCESPINLAVREGFEPSVLFWSTEI
jgi:hypothetical protein